MNEYVIRIKYSCGCTYERQTQVSRHDGLTIKNGDKCPACTMYDFVQRDQILMKQPELFEVINERT